LRKTGNNEGWNQKYDLSSGWVCPNLIYWRNWSKDKLKDIATEGEEE
jgi:hypothetical protein